MSSRGAPRAGRVEWVNDTLYVTAADGPTGAGQRYFAVNVPLGNGKRVIMHLGSGLAATVRGQLEQQLGQAPGGRAA